METTKIELKIDIEKTRTDLTNAVMIASQESNGKLDIVLELLQKQNTKNNKKRDPRS